jgi:hypothetical protein
MIATMSARPSAAIRETVERAFLSALPAFVTVAVADMPDVIEAGLVIRELGEKIAD